MANQFYKGRTNNHLTWVMVDATDFATPESALSAAMTIKIYGKVRGATGTNFVSSGTGSLTNDITHVGASATGMYTIALAKADLSDASAAWYDQYIIHLSATGAARQTLVVDGGIDLSALSAYQSRLSDIASALLVTQSMASDAASAAQQANSRVLVAQSAHSDMASYLVVMSGVQSDIYSALLVTQSQASDLASKLSDVESNLLSLIVTTGVNLNTSVYSDLRSAIAAGPAATITASDISDIASAVKAILASDLSDIYSAVSNINSIAASSPDASDVASAVWAEAAGAAVSSRVLLNLSRISDVQSALTVVQSMASDAASAAQQGNSRLLVNQSVASDIYSRVLAGVELSASALSDVASAVNAQVLDVLTVDTFAEPTAVPAATATLKDKIGWVTALSRNKITQTSAVQSLRNDADSADIASAAVSDDGTTATRGEFA